jgi:hypothetical protein
VVVVHFSIRGFNIPWGLLNWSLFFFRILWSRWEENNLQ